MQEFPKLGNIVFSVIPSNERSIPLEMHFLDSLIIIHNERPSLGEYWIEVLDSEGMKISSFFTRGRGPEELLGVSSSGLIENKLWLYDSKNTTFWIIDDINFNISPTYRKKEIGKRLHTVELWNDSILLAISNITGARFKVDRYNYLLDKFDGGLGNLNTLPEIIDVIPFTGEIYNGIELFVEKGVFFGTYRVRPDGNKIAIAYKYFDAIEIYSKNGELIKAIRGSENIFPELYTQHSEHGSGLVHPENTKLGYRSMVCTENYIYAAFSGDSFFNFEADKIFVFDWEGNPIKSFSLNYPIGAFCVDENNGLIYSVSNNTGELIKGQFNLN